MPNSNSMCPLKPAVCIDFAAPVKKGPESGPVRDVLAEERRGQPGMPRSLMRAGGETENTFFISPKYPRRRRATYESPLHVWLHRQSL